MKNDFVYENNSVKNVGILEEKDKIKFFDIPIYRIRMFVYSVIFNEYAGFPVFVLSEIAKRNNLESRFDFDLDCVSYDNLLHYVVYFYVIELGDEKIDLWNYLEEKFYDESFYIDFQSEFFKFLNDDFYYVIDRRSRG